MNKKDIINLIETLKAYYPDAKCSLDFDSPYHLAIAVLLSAQCTDERVNKTTPLIFQKCSTPQDFVNIDISELENLVHPCGFYKNKSRNIKLMAQKIISDYNGILPTTMEELITLPGIGRKSANVIMLDAYNNPQGIAVDTHAKRVSNRIGLSKESSPEKIEIDLLNKFPKKYYADVNHLFVWHGRYTCTARNPKCNSCPIKHYCKFAKSVAFSD